MRFIKFALLALSICGLYQSAAHAQIDLAVDQISKQGKNIQIRVRNLGKRQSPSTLLNVWLQDNDTQNALENRLLTVPPINAGRSQTFVLKKLGQKIVMTRNLLVTAKVDPRLRIRESNERNNLLQRVIRMRPVGKPIPLPIRPKLPDLKISSISKRGNDFIVKVINYGDSRSKPCILATWAVDKQTLKVTKVERYVPALKVGASHRLVVDRVPKAKGNITVTSVIDSRKKIAERIETNNRMEITFATAKPVKASADLIVSRIDFPSPTLVDVTIRNQGTGTTGGRFRVRLEVFDKDQTRRLYMTEKQFPRLGTNQKATLQFESKVRILRPMIVVIKPDINNVIRETNERNNPTLQVR